MAKSYESPHWNVDMEKRNEFEFAAKTDEQRTRCHTNGMSLWKIGLIGLVVVAVVVVALSNGTTGAKRHGALEATANIKNGYLVDSVDDYPFVVYLESKRIGKFTRLTKWTSHCTGTIVHPKWVLTAAHCVGSGGDLANKVTARAGILDRDISCHFFTNNCQDESLDDKVIQHPIWVKSRGVDIAMVRVSAFKMKDAVNVADWKNAPKAVKGEDVIGIGWGVTDEEATMPSRYLKEARMVVASITRGTIADSVRPEGRTGEKDGIILDGDSGGPLIDATTHKLLAVQKVAMDKLWQWVEKVIDEET